MSKRKSATFPFTHSKLPQLLNWAEKHDFFAFFNGNDHQTLNDPFPRVLFVGVQAQMNSGQDSFETFDAFIDLHDDWIWGYFNYELKNEIEALNSSNPATIPADHMRFVVPKTVILVHEQTLEILSFNDPESEATNIFSTPDHPDSSKGYISKPTSRTTKSHYYDRIEKIKKSIVEGEFYEMNYCIEYTAKSERFDPITRYRKLNEVSPMPFSVLMKTDNTYLICASPERFLKKVGNTIYSQPIKGTIMRSFEREEDERLKHELLNSEKEQAENLMIVDLVRNDLAKSAVPGTVMVDELFGIYTFKKIHQMISTVSAKLKPGMSPGNIIKNAFPPGSMTGAPKVRVMQEIESLEDSARGLYSGSVGFFTPGRNFDFNVVIRSVIFDKSTGNISFHVGSAITYDSDPEYEYNECLLKAEALFEVLNS